jgi:hypothetical protein
LWKAVPWSVLPIIQRNISFIDIFRQGITDLPAMRVLLLFMIITGFFSPDARGQELSDSSFYSPGIRMIRLAKTAEDYNAAAAYFMDLTAHKSGQWLGYYYTALCYIQASYKTGSDKGKDAVMDKAQPCIDNAFKLRPEEAELWVLQAFLYQSRIQINPEMRGMSYSMKADACLKKATAADEGNPRAWSLMGYNMYHTPALFGGGAQKALPLFLKAREKFRVFKPIMPFLPEWGEPENQNMIAECRKSLK